MDLNRPHHAEPFDMGRLRITKLSNERRMPLRARSIGLDRIECVRDRDRDVTLRTVSVPGVQPIQQRDGR